MEKRLYPRINVNIPARIKPSGNQTINVRLIDTSCSVLKLECNQVAYNILSPEDGWRHRGQSTEVEIEMALPDGSGQVQATCEVAFSRRVSKNRFELGLRYSDVSADDFGRLTQFIDLCIRGQSVQAI